MPVLPRLRIEALANLARELRFESPEAARRQLHRAEALALEVLADSGNKSGADRTYPLDYIRFRITGLAQDARSSDDGAGRGRERASVMLVGDALLADLPALVERLSVAAGITVAELADGVASGSSGAKPRASRRPTRDVPTSPLRGPWLELGALCGHWSVGRKTVERLRRRGLLARRARISVDRGTRGAAARQRLLFSQTAIGAMELAGAAPVQAAAAMSARPVRSQIKAARAPRLSAAEQARIARRGAVYRKRFGWTLHKCAERIAPTIGRSVETVRRALRNHDRAADRPVFTERGPLTVHERTLVERSRRVGASPAATARKLGRSVPTVHRVALDRRAERLRALDLTGPIGPLFARAGAADVHLAPVSVTTGLGAGAPGTLGEFVSGCDSMEPPALAIESARAVAYWYLRHRAAVAVSRMPANGASAAAIDAIETDLRWASRLKAELMRAQLPTVLRSIRARLDGRGPELLPPRGVGGGPALVHACIGALIESIDRFDPFKALTGGGRLAAPAAIAVNRVLTHWLQARERAGQSTTAAAGALASRKSETAALDDWTLRVDPWQAWLEAPPPIAARVRADDSDTADQALRVIRLRFGFGPSGAPPITASGAAKRLGTTAARVSAIERRALAGLPATTPPLPNRKGRATRGGGDRG